MVRLKVTMKIADTLAASRKFRKSAQLTMSNAMLSHAKFAASFVQKERFIPYPGPFNEDKSRTKLYNRTGKLRRSIRGTEIGGKRGAVVEAGRGLPDLRAPNNEFSAVISGSPNVAVPLPANLTEKTGQPKSGSRTPSEALENGARFARTAKGNLLIVRDGPRKTIQALFLLVPSVFIPARFGLGETVLNDPKLVKDRSLRLSNSVKRLISRSFGL